MTVVATTTARSTTVSPNELHAARANAPATSSTSVVAGSSRFRRGSRSLTEAARSIALHVLRRIAASRPRFTAERAERLGFVFGQDRAPAVERGADRHVLAQEPCEMAQAVLDDLRVTDGRRRPDREAASEVDSRHQIRRGAG